MTLNLEISDELQGRIQAEAERRGLTVETFALQQLDSILPATTKMTISDMLNYFETHAVRVPVNPNATYSREEIYSDHD